MTKYTWIPIVVVVFFVVSYIACDGHDDVATVFYKRSQDLDMSEEEMLILDETTEDSTMDSNEVTTDAYEDYCAPSEDIWPCVCSGDTSYVTLTCHGVVDRGILDKALSSSYPIRDMNILDIQQSKIGNVTADFLEGNTFEEINMFGSGIENLDMDAFLGSRERLSLIRLQSNALITFDFRKITQYPLLEFLALSSNFLPDIDSLVGMEPHWKFLYLYVGNNEITSINETTFDAVPNVTMIDLSHNLLTSLPHNVFFRLENLQSLYLYNNNIVHLRTGDLWFSTPILRVVDFRRNNLKVVDDDTFKGVISSPRIDMDFNDIDYFSYDAFGPLLKNISLEYGFISIWFNRMVCDCELLWVLMDDNMMDHLLNGSCKNHTDIHSLNVDAYIDECATDP